jgi:hypothetical protein
MRAMLPRRPQNYRDRVATASGLSEISIGYSVFSSGSARIIAQYTLYFELGV